MAIKPKRLTREKYGAWWDARLQDAQIEMECIRRGGRWEIRRGQTCGAGLYEHMLKLQAMLWPDMDDHRWHRLCLKTICENQVTVLMGPASTAKTNEAAKFGLCEYFSAPEDTAVLVSSTDLRGLELRIWGEIKMLFSQARERFGFLPGHLIDSKHCITTDDLKEGDIRDLRRGVIGIPCIINNKM